MKKFRILPVFPEFPSPSFWNYRYALEMLRKGATATMPPTGLATVLAMLPEEHFDLQRIIDLNVEPLTDEHLDDSDLVFTSSMIVQGRSLEEVIQRAHNRGKKVVAGGPYPTSYPDKVHADYLVLGEAEATLRPFIFDFMRGKAKSRYDEHSVGFSEKPTITETPVPRWDLLNLKNYFSLAVQYSRGCPYKCDFCDIPVLYGGKSRTKTPEQMAREFDAIYSVGWRGPVFVVDDNFIGNASNVRELLPVLENWQKSHKHPFTLFTEASMNLGMPNFRDIREGMVRSGFDQVFLGIESPDPDVIKKMNKGQNLGDPAEKIKAIQNAGLEVTGGFIIGSDGEKPGAGERLFDFIQENGIVISMPGLLNALPGTRLYNRLEKEGRLRGESSGNNTHHLEFNFVPERDEKTILQEYSTLLEKLFNSRNYFKRCRVLNERRGEHYKPRINLSGVRAFKNILYEKFVKHPDKEFAKYLIETVLHSPSKIPDAVTYEVKLHHFQTITQAVFDVERYKEHTQTLYERFKARALEVGQGMHDFRERVISTEQEVILDARRKYAKIHKDFRTGAREAYKSLVKRIKEYRTEALATRNP